jgi:hypothetical protein
LTCDSPIHGPCVWWAAKLARQGAGIAKDLPARDSEPVNGRRQGTKAHDPVGLQNTIRE